VVIAFILPLIKALQMKSAWMLKMALSKALQILYRHITVKNGERRHQLLKPQK
jgi:hypothetical protein